MISWFRKPAEAAEAAREPAVGLAPTPQPERESGGSRNFTGIAVGRLHASWKSGASLNESIATDLAGLRERSRSLEKNNDYVKRYLKLTETNVIGSKGIALQCRFRTADGKLDTRTNDEIEAAFEAWGRRGSCDVTGRHSWVGVQNLVVKALKADGEAFVRIVRGKKFNRFAVALQFIRPDDIDENLNLQTETITITQGVELDEWNRPVAFIVKGTEKSATAWHWGKPYVRVPAAEMIHIFEPIRDEQIRGVPDTRTTTARLDMLGGYQEAALVDARAAACKGGFFKKTDPDAEPYKEDDPDSEWSSVTMRQEPGMYQRLPLGWEFQERNHDSPKDTYAPFIKTNLQGVGTSLNTSYSALANDYEGVNYSSLRASLQIERDIYEALQTFVVDTLVRPVFQIWLARAVALKQLRIPLAQIETYKNPYFAPRKWPWVDPQKEAQANSVSVREGFKSLTEVAAERGRAIEDILFEKKREQEMAESLGLDLAEKKEVQG